MFDLKFLEEKQREEKEFLEKYKKGTIKVFDKATGKCLVIVYPDGKSIK